MEIRIGQGIDIHQIVEDRPFVLGGIHIPHEKGLLGHSDADALLHSITDALLGAVAKGDIGAHFPDTDPRWKDVDSKYLLAEVWNILKKENWSISNIDTTILLEKPKLRDFIEPMRKSISSLLDLNVDQVSIKATTSEKMGFVGKGEGIEVHSSVLITRP